MIMIILIGKCPSKCCVFYPVDLGLELSVGHVIFYHIPKVMSWPLDETHVYYGLQKFQ